MTATPFSDLIKQAAEAKFVVIPNADYPIVCKNASDTKASTGKDMIKMTVAVIAGPHKGATIPTQQVLSPENPAAVAIFLKAMAAFGITEEWLAALPPRQDGGPNIAALAAELRGKTAMASVTTSTWNDEDRNQIERFKKPTPEQQAVIEEAMSEFGASFVAPAAAGDPFASASAAAGSAAPDKDPF